MKVILSIKPKYAEKILNGEKIYELRKRIFKKKVDKVYIYASAPISKIIGEFDIDHILYLKTEDLWNITKKLSCVNKSFFIKYFTNQEKGYAIKIKNPKRYKEYLNIKDHFGHLPPQNFVYID